MCEEKLNQDRAMDQLALVEQEDLTIGSVQPEVRTLFSSRTQPEPEDPGERASRFRQTIELLGRFASGVPFVCNTGPPPNGNVQEVFDVAAREYRTLAEFAAEVGSSIALEPLNPVLMNVESAIWTLDQAMQIVGTVNHPNFGLCIDIWNIWQNPEVSERLRAYGEHILVVHVSDWRTPRSFTDRHVVGRGEVPLPPLLRAIHDGGYRGAYTLEIFSDEVTDSLWEADLSEIITESRDAFERAWREAMRPA